MNRAMVRRAVGLALLCEAGLLLLPALTALIYGEQPRGFVLTAALAGTVGGLLLSQGPNSTFIYAREGFVSVSLAWLALSFFGALPYLLTGAVTSPVDALFETVSGLSTTGASIFTEVESLPRSLLLWRSLTQWIGGMGVLVFVLAVLPLAGSRALYLMRAEMPGPSVGKLTPRVRGSARLLYLMYVGLTLAEALALLIAGLSPYDAITHALATAGTGGFSTYNAGVSVFPAPTQLIIALFMLAFGVNFNVYHLLMKRRLRRALSNEELRWYLLIVAGSVLSVALCLARTPGLSDRPGLDALFQVSSIITTTGFATADFDLWPAYARALLLLLMLLGACAGSTGGGLKVSRLLIMVKVAAAQIRRLLRPNLVNGVRVAGDQVDGRAQEGIFVFAFLYALLLLMGSLLLSLGGWDLTTCSTAALACLSNIGPGLGAVGPSGNYALFSPAAKLLLAALMLLGRLEIWPLLILISPEPRRLRS